MNTSIRTAMEACVLVTAHPSAGSLADVVDRVLQAVPGASHRRVVLMARHCRRELELAGAFPSTDVMTERAIERIRGAHSHAS